MVSQGPSQPVARMDRPQAQEGRVMSQQGEALPLVPRTDRLAAQWEQAPAAAAPAKQAPLPAGLQTDRAQEEVS